MPRPRDLSSSDPLLLQPHQVRSILTFEVPKKVVSLAWRLQDQVQQGMQRTCRWNPPSVL